jgi:antitoxin VapB
MFRTKTAKLFLNGRSQAVRLPREFRFEGDEVRIRQVGDGVLLEPIIVDISKWFAELDRFKAGPFMKKGSRQQPMNPRREIFD